MGKFIHYFWMQCRKAILFCYFLSCTIGTTLLSRNLLIELFFYTRFKYFTTYITLPIIIFIRIFAFYYVVKRTSIKFIYKFLASSDILLHMILFLLCPKHAGHDLTLYDPLSPTILVPTLVCHLYPHLLHFQLTCICDVTDNSSGFISIFAS